jgi:hypothetical protein
MESSGVEVTALAINLTIPEALGRGRECQHPHAVQREVFGGGCLGHAQDPSGRTFGDY